MTKLVSADEIVQEAKKQMLEGRQPESQEDWALIMNFIAFNVDKEKASLVCKVIARLYNMPLNDSQVEAIVIFQQARKGG